MPVRLCLIVTFAVLSAFPVLSDETDSLPALRELAQAQGIFIGAAANMRIESDEHYAETLATHFSMLTPENELKFHRTQPRRGQFTFERGDALVDFAESHGMKVRGHALVWHQGTPDWVEETEWTREELIEVMHEHIRTVAGRYRGRLHAWDVVNEYFDKNGGVRESIWSKTIGPEFMELAHRFAREADPEAKLFVNDYENHEICDKSDGMYEWVKTALERGVPVDGVGFQMHIPFDYEFDEDDFKANLKRFAKLGLEIHITELDIRIKQPVTEEKLKRQAELYGKILDACMDAPACKAFVMWGVSDKYSWVPRFFEGHDDGLIFDRAFQPKPAFQALVNTLSVEG